MSTCTVCNHDKTKEIEKLFIQGKPNTQIAEQYDLNHQAVRNHGKKHLPQRIINAKKRKQRSHNSNILEHLDGIVNDTKSILDEALEDGQKSIALQAIKESRNNMKLLSQIAVKQAEFADKDHKKEEAEVDQEIQESLKILTDDELNTLLFLQAKMEANDSNYMADATSAMVVGFVNSDSFAGPNTSTDITERGNNSNETDDTVKSGVSPNEPRYGEKVNTDRRHNHLRADKNTQRNPQMKRTKAPQDDDEKPLELHDLADFDLEGDNSSSEIPSEKTDPEWRVKEQRRKNRYGQ
jgi:hypothetical protein